MTKKDPKLLGRRKHREHDQEAPPVSTECNIANEHLSRNVQSNEQILRSIFEDCSDVVFRPIQFEGETKLLVVYIDGVNDTKILDEAVLKPLLFQGAKSGNLTNLNQMIRDQLVPVAQTKIVSTIQELVENIVKCTVAILLDGENVALIAEMKAFATRSVEEPANELSIRGPREGFTESLRVNTSLIRKRLRNPQLKMETVTLGTETKTDVVIAYMRGIVNEDLLGEIRTRIHRIQIDGILDSGNIEELIQDDPYSPFPQIQNTERPDTVTAGKRSLEPRVSQR
jgi:Bacillus/Clostridium GerA spore germination protein